jgi:DNA-directed RNA polymerase subunit RPC12/RpoP
MKYGGCYMETNYEIIEIKCPRCGHDKSYKRFHNCSEFGECISCGKMTYHKLIRNPKEVRCPYCHSANTKKISTASKVGNVALFGVFALGKTMKEWHYNNCKSDF